METLPDGHIAKLVQQGDHEKFGLLMERYEEKLSRYGRRFLSDPEGIGDIVQDVFVSAYQNIQGFDPGRSFSAWIYRIAHNAFVNSLRKRGHRFIPHFDFDIFLSHYVPEAEGFDEREHETMKEMVEKGLSNLEPKYREVIVLHFLEEMSYREIADILKVPTGTVGVRVMRGKRMLRQIYERMNIKNPYGRI